jgi:nicotinamide-nucleotide amidase
MPAMQAAILSIGDELALGQTVDTNTAWLADQLARRGLMSRLHLTTADDQSAILAALRWALSQAELILVTGGLGPTEDDLTRFALAELMGTELQLDQASLDAIAAFFARRGRTMAQRNQVQAMCPVGAAMLDNPVGTAPGIRALIDGKAVICMPGVPSEMRHMFQRHVAGALDEQTGRVIRSAVLHTFGKGESDIAQMLGELMRRDRNPLVGTTVARGIVSVRIRSEAGDVPSAESALETTIGEVKSVLGELVFGRDDQTLAQCVGRKLDEAGRTLAVAESCTGGLLAKLLTDTPGSSGYFLGGWVTYANAMKQGQLSVEERLIREHGAVSQPVAEAMARGVLGRSDADYALATTGIAGPGGGSREKPVGTVWIALARRMDDHTVKVEAQLHVLPGDRAMVRLRTAHAALNLLRRAI